MPSDLINLINDYVMFLPTEKLWNKNYVMKKCLYVENIGLLCSWYNDKIYILDYKTGVMKAEYLGKTPLPDVNLGMDTWGLLGFDNMLLNDLARRYCETTHIIIDKMHKRLITASKRDCRIWKSNDNWKSAYEIGVISFGKQGEDITCVLLLKSGELLIGGYEPNKNIMFYNIEDVSLIRKIRTTEMQDSIVECKNGDIIMQYEDEKTGCYGVAVFNMTFKKITKLFLNRLDCQILDDNKIIIYNETNTAIYDDSYELISEVDSYINQKIPAVYNMNNTLAAVPCDNNCMKILSKNTLKTVKTIMLNKYKNICIHNDVIITTDKKGIAKIYDSYGDFLRIFEYEYANLISFKAGKQNFIVSCGRENSVCYGEIVSC